jgi:hypothetical protein
LLQVHNIGVEWALEWGCLHQLLWLRMEFLAARRT